MPPTADDRLADIATAIARIESFTSGMTFAEFEADPLKRAATERFLEIVCEASRRLPDSVKSEASHIEWRKMIDFGNVLRHAYHLAKIDIVWSVIHDDLPALKAFVAAHRRTP